VKKNGKEEERRDSEIFGSIDDILQMANQEKVKEEVVIKKKVIEEVKVEVKHNKKRKYDEISVSNVEKVVE
jgi:hypothetical protein